jgi:hypothetical protein
MPHRLTKCGGDTENLGMDSHTESEVTLDGPETYTYEMAPTSLFPTMAPTKTPGDLVVS